MVIGETMNELLSYLIEHLAFLYNDYGARFVDSEVRAPQALLVLEMTDLRLRLVNDRTQLFLDFQSTHHPDRDDWFSFDIVRQFITGEVVDSAELDEAKIAFTKEHLVEIAKAFSADDYRATESTMHKFEQERGERLFG